jgi:hypothetical protein
MSHCKLHMHVQQQPSSVVTVRRQGRKVGMRATDCFVATGKARAFVTFVVNRDQLDSLRCFRCGAVPSVSAALAPVYSLLSGVERPPLRTQRTEERLLAVLQKGGSNEVARALVQQLCKHAIPIRVRKSLLLDVDVLVPCRRTSTQDKKTCQSLLCACVSATSTGLEHSLLHTPTLLRKVDHALQESRLASGRWIVRCAASAAPAL